MLERPRPARPCRQAQQRRRRHAATVARARERERRGTMLVTVEIDKAGINWLVHVARSLPARECYTKAEVGAAISHSITISAKKNFL